VTSSLPFDYFAALWGVFGAAANAGIVFIEACRRVKGWPWCRPNGPGGGVYVASVVINVAVAGVTTAAMATANITSSGLVAFGVGAAAPVAVKKVSRYAQSLLPALENPADGGSESLGREDNSDLSDPPAPEQGGERDA
jgi:hypothetical protein